MSRSVALSVPRFAQPDDVTCGPTSLRQVLSFYGDDKTHEEVAQLIPQNEDGGTLGVFLGLAALELGYRATIYPYNLRVFDPTWFGLSREGLLDKLEARAAIVPGRKLRAAVEAYAAFVDGGGQVQFAEMSPKLLVSILERGHPIISGLSATYLYRTPREIPDINMPDDVRGEPVGHFVTVSGHRNAGRTFLIADPDRASPLGAGGRYEVPARRLINAILLGDVTYDAVLLEIE